jgi:hypothetical protein
MQNYSPNYKRFCSITIGWKQVFHFNKKNINLEHFLKRYLYLLEIDAYMSFSYRIGQVYRAHILKYVRYGMEERESKGKKRKK